MTGSSIHSSLRTLSTFVCVQLSKIKFLLKIIPILPSDCWDNDHKAVFVPYTCARPLWSVAHHAYTCRNRNVGTFHFPVLEMQSLAHCPRPRKTQRAGVRILPLACHCLHTRSQSSWLVWVQHSESWTTAKPTGLCATCNSRPVCPCFICLWSNKDTQNISLGSWIIFVQTRSTRKRRP